MKTYVDGRSIMGIKDHATFDVNMLISGETVPSCRMYVVGIWTLFHAKTKIERRKSSHI